MAVNMLDTDVAIIGAGPYGLSAAAHLRRAGVDTHVLGDPMSFWRSMPTGGMLRSNFGATNIGELHGETSIKAYQAETGDHFDQPVPLDKFVAYGMWVQRRVAPDLDRRLVSRVQRDGEAFALTLDDGARLRARRVLVACGIDRFAHWPERFQGLPSSLVSHTGQHADMSVFAGRDIAVIGGGQSALEGAALAHEAGARPEVIARGGRIVWLRGKGVKKRLGRLGPVVYAPTDVGPLWYSRLVATPRLFTSLPRRVQTPIARRSIRPAGAHWLVDRLTEVPIHLGRQVVAAQPQGDRLHLTLDDGSARTVDHLLLGTGYQVDIARYPFLAPELLMAVRRAGGYPLLGRGMESSVPRLHFLGAPSSWSFGPIMRFVSGSWYTGRELAQHIAGGSAPRAAATPVLEPAIEEVQPRAAAAGARRRS
jgi:NADPH-dependent 2,4-dienoyl-CoA reductase/sulfur reductase-like enzyme